MKHSINCKNLKEKSIYTEKGTYIGKIDDVVFNVDKQQVDGIILDDVPQEIRNLKDNKPQKIIIPYTFVQSINDVAITIPIHRQSLQ